MPTTRADVIQQRSTRTVLNNRHPDVFRFGVSTGAGARDAEAGFVNFYQRRGYRLVTVRPGAIDEARRIKPEIPLIGHDGIGIHDEVELERFLF
ncbi:MAG: hypothetical protein M0Z53_09410 [Thermaerobacter sp.]|nr:hypothetical protein [Thermaerobacter sp.]